jgi:hypothetical protein
MATFFPSNIEPASALFRRKGENLIKSAHFIQFTRKGAIYFMNKWQ